MCVWGEQVSTQAQRDAFQAALSAAEDWIYDESDGEEAPAFRCGAPPHLPRPPKP